MTDQECILAFNVLPPTWKYICRGNGCNLKMGINASTCWHRMPLNQTMRNAPIFRVEFVEFNLEFNVSSIVTRFDILNDFIYANIIHNFKEVWVTINLTPQFLLELFEFGESISLLDLLLNFVISDAWNQRVNEAWSARLSFSHLSLNPFSYCSTTSMMFWS